MKVVVKIMVAAALMCSATVSMAQDTKIRFFGQPEIRTSSVKETNRFNGVSGTGQYLTSDTTYSKTNFNTGNFVLFVTSQLSERISVLSEVSFNNKVDGVTGKNSFDFEVQRLAVKYYIHDYFSIRAGKMFTPIGYWNNQFTLGLVLQPTIQRPLAIRPVSEGGVTQYRDIGVQFEGENITNARFFYKVLVGNGIGYHGASDKGDDHVAVTTQIGAEPIEGFKVLASGMFDRIEAGKLNPNGSMTLPDDGNLQMLTLATAYMNAEKKPEFIVEYSQQHSKFDNITESYSTSFYAYGGYKVTDKITPYVLYNYVQAGKSTTEMDPYFAPLPLKINTLTIGARYKFNANFVAKVEYELNDQKTYYQDIMMGNVKLDDGFTNGYKTNSVRVQLAFAF